MLRGGRTLTRGLVRLRVGCQAPVASASPLCTISGQNLSTAATYFDNNDERFSIVGLQDDKVREAKKLGFDPTDDVLYFGTGAVTNTLIALMSQCMSSMHLQSRHADHLVQTGIQLQHRGDIYEVDPETVRVVQDPSELKGGDPRIIVNGRQVGGNYDEIFDACGPSTQFIVTAQNGNSSQALFRAAESYMDRYPEREPIVRNIIGIDAAMFVKMSGTESKSRTILQPGAKWLFGAFSLKDGSGTGIKGNAQVDEATINECQRFVNFFELLDATDGRNSADVKLNPETVSGKLLKTANNIGGNYGAAIITRLVQTASEAEMEIGGQVSTLEGPLPYGVLHPSYGVEPLKKYVGVGRLEELRQQVSDVRRLSLAAVSEFYVHNSEHFSAAGLDEAQVLEAARLYWTELDPCDCRIPSKHPPTHALAMFERRPSEPLLDDVIDGMSADASSSLRKLRDFHRRVEQETALPYAFKENEKHGWLEGPDAKAIVRKAEKHGHVDEVDLVSIKSYQYKKPLPPTMFLPALYNMGEHAISYMERLGEYKAFYESIPTANKPPFLNLTIGGVYRDTPPRTDVNASRGYVTHLSKAQKELVADIFGSLGMDLRPSQVGISPMRAKLALQHALGLFKPGVLVSHRPNYKATVDAAVMNFGHSSVEVDVRGRYISLFEEVRLQAGLEKNKDKPIILLLVCPQNPTAICMNDEDEEDLHELIEEFPNVSVLHDIAYQGYNEVPRDASKRYRDEGMPHRDQVYMAILSTSKSMYASGQPSLWTSDKRSFPFLVNHYQRVATGPTSTFVHDLQYYKDTLDSTYMRSVENKLQRPMLDFIDANKDRWGVDYLVRPDGPPFITLDVSDKLLEMGVTSKGFREITLRLGVPVLVTDGVLRIALTGFDKSKHDEVLPLLLDRLDHVLSLTKNSDVTRVFKEQNPHYTAIATYKTIPD